MKKQIWYFFVILVIIMITVGAVTFYDRNEDSSTQINETVQRFTALPPASLDALYPPKAEQPVWMLKMFEMDYPFAGIIVDILEGDFEKAKDNFEKFKAQYLEISKMVPEWEKEFPMKPIDELGEALKTGDPGIVMETIENVGMVCHNCHISNMVPVQQKYHWPNFHAITVQDPLTNEILDFPRLMQYLSVTFTGILLNVERGNIENAQKYLQGFNARFQTLRESCDGCHDTERKYYVDDSVQSVIDQLGQAIAAPTIDPNTVMGLSYEIGMQSCQKCHLVHLPAAYAKLGWQKLERSDNK